MDARGAAGAAGCASPTLWLRPAGDGGAPARRHHTGVAGRTIGRLSRHRNRSARAPPPFSARLPEPLPHPYSRVPGTPWGRCGTPCTHIAEVSQPPESREVLPPASPHGGPVPGGCRASGPIVRRPGSLLTVAAEGPKGEIRLALAGAAGDGPLARPHALAAPRPHALAAPREIARSLRCA